MSTTTYTSTNSRRCASCWQRPGRCLNTCPDHPDATQMIASTRLDGLTITGVMRAVDKAPQSHAQGRVYGRRVPVRYIALIFLGLVLMGIGLASPFLGPIIYEVIPR